ncbi:MAG: hypothetical protein ABIT09_03525 [Croceibacterium sp.]
MSVIALRATILAAGATALMLTAGPALAQVDRTAVLNILVECAKIDDPTARLACYDNNMTRAGAIARATVPGRSRVQGGGAPLASSEGPAGFGRESLKNGERFTGPAGQMQSIRPKIAAVAQRQPNVYLVTLEDGAQWVFAQAADNQYRSPTRGAIVEIERGAMGNFLMRVDGQRPIQVLRVK